MNNIEIKIASPSDAEAILNIYAPYIKNTAITFEYEVPSVEEFRKRIIHTLKRFPYLLALKGEEIIGYAYAGPLHVRAAYAWSVETSIYVKKDHKGKGMGRALYEAMEYVLKKQNVINSNACIAYPEKEDQFLTRDSVKFHSRLGYQKVAEFHQCAYKFGNWYNMVWMEKFLREHPQKPQAFRPFEEVRKELKEWEP